MTLHASRSAALSRGLSQQYTVASCAAARTPSCLQLYSMYDLAVTFEASKFAKAKAAEVPDLVFMQIK